MRETKQRIGKQLFALVLVGAMLMVLLGNTSVANAASPNPAAYAPVFDATYYAAKYPDLAAAFGTNEALLFSHFLNCGMKEGRQGSAEFNVQAYKERYADLQAAFGDNLPAYYMHYITNGKAEGRDATIASAQPAATQPTTPVVNTNPTANYAQQVIDLVNADRAQNGLQPVSATPELMAAAQIRAQEISTYFSHTRPDGTRCFTVFATTGVTYRCCGENIAAGQPTPAAVEDAWMHSEGHRANILTAGFGHIGVGFLETDGGYGTYWVQMFTN